MSLSEITAAMAALQEREIPPMYFLCGRNVFRELLLTSGVNPATPEGEHALNTALSRVGIPGTNPATFLFGVRVVLSDFVDPDFWQVLPDPAYVWRNP